jgi:hypothetical protein
VAPASADAAALGDPGEGATGAGARSDLAATATALEARVGEADAEATTGQPQPLELTAPVGLGAENRPEDVARVTEVLIHAGYVSGARELSIAELGEGIRQYQTDARLAVRDGVLDPGKRSERALNRDLERGRLAGRGVTDDVIADLGSADPQRRSDAITRARGALLAGNSEVINRFTDLLIDPDTIRGLSREPAAFLGVQELAARNLARVPAEHLGPRQYQALARTVTDEAAGPEVRQVLSRDIAAGRPGALEAALEPLGDEVEFDFEAQRRLVLAETILQSGADLPADVVERVTTARDRVRGRALEGGLSEGAPLFEGDSNPLYERLGAAVAGGDPEALAVVRAALAETPLDVAGDSPDEVNPSRTNDRIATALHLLSEHPEQIRPEDIARITELHRVGSEQYEFGVTGAALDALDAAVRRDPPVAGAAAALSSLGSDANDEINGLLDRAIEDSAFAATIPEVILEHAHDRAIGRPSRAQASALVQDAIVTMEARLQNGDRAAADSLIKFTSGSWRTVNANTEAATSALEAAASGPHADVLVDALLASEPPRYGRPIGPAHQALGLQNRLLGEAAAHLGVMDPRLEQARVRLRDEATAGRPGAARGLGFMQSYLGPEEHQALTGLLSSRNTAEATEAGEVLASAIAAAPSAARGELLEGVLEKLPAGPAFTVLNAHASELGRDAVPRIQEHAEGDPAAVEQALASIVAESNEPGARDAAARSLTNTPLPRVSRETLGALQAHAYRTEDGQLFADMERTFPALNLTPRPELMASIPMTTGRAYEVFADPGAWERADSAHGGRPDGIIRPADMQRVADDVTAPIEVRRAASHLIQNDASSVVTGEQQGFSFFPPVPGWARESILAGAGTQRYHAYNGSKQRGDRRLADAIEQRSDQPGDHSLRIQPTGR